MIIENREFRNIRVRDQADIPPEGAELRGCSFTACSVSVTSESTEPLTVRGFQVDGGTLTGGGLRGVHLADCVVKDLQLKSGPRFLGCVFEHVRITGRVSQLMIHDNFTFVLDPEPFRQAAREAYSSIDWALDITELSCPDLDVRGVPARLIRFDPEKNFVVRKEALAGRDWRSLDYAGTAYRPGLQMLETSSWEDILMEIPAGKKRGPALEVIDRMRDLGLVDA